MDDAQQLKEALRIADRVAWRYFGKFAGKVEWDDVLSDAYLGALLALRQWDPGRGTTFQRFVWTKIARTVIDERRKVLGRWRKWDETPRPESLDATLMINEGRDVTLHDIVRDPRVDVEVAALARIALTQMASDLNPRQQEIFLRTAAGYTAAEMATDQSVSYQAIAQVKAQGRGRLAKPGAARGGIAASPNERLSMAEYDVLVATALGESATETAKRTHRSVETIKDHRKAVIRKTKTRNMVHAVFSASKLGLLSEVDPGLSLR